MAVLSKEEYLNKLQEKFGSDSSDESISFVEDMVDTYSDLEKRNQGDGVDWQKKYNDLDAYWKKRYRTRFFSGAPMNTAQPEAEEEDQEDRATRIGINDLFQRSK